jgi:hypothetical protein
MASKQKSRTTATASSTRTGNFLVSSDAALGGQLTFPTARYQNEILAPKIPQIGLFACYDARAGA